MTGPEQSNAAAADPTQPQPFAESAREQHARPFGLTPEEAEMLSLYL